MIPKPGEPVLRLADLRREDVQALAPQAIVARGWTYFLEERVLARVSLGDRIAARVVGSDRDYHTGVAEGPDGLVFRCDCPFEGPVCKHHIALLFDWVERSGEYYDAGGLARELACLPDRERERLFRELLWNDWGLIERAAREAGLATVPEPGPEAMLAGLICRYKSPGLLSYDEADSLARRLRHGLDLLEPGLARCAPSAARTLRHVVEASRPLLPEMDDVSGAFADSLGRAVAMLVAVLDWWPREADEGNRLAGLFLALALDERWPARSEFAQILQGLRLCVAKGYFPPDGLSQFNADNGNGGGALMAAMAVIRGGLDRRPAMDPAVFRELVDGLRFVAAAHAEEWHRFFGRLAGECWRSPELQAFLIDEASGAPHDETNRSSDP